MGEALIILAAVALVGGFIGGVASSAIVLSFAKRVESRVVAVEANVVKHVEEVVKAL